MMYHTKYEQPIGLSLEGPSTLYSQRFMGSRNGENDWLIEILCVYIVLNYELLPSVLSTKFVEGGDYLPVCRS